MEQKDIYSYAYDFISRLIERVDMEAVKSIIVFGSVVRGDFDKESDVDIFIDTEKERSVEPDVRTVINEFYSHSRGTWVLRGVENQIIPIVGNLDSDKWENLKREIISNGLVVYGKYKELPKNIERYVLITYDISRLKPKEKSKFSRGLLGYRLMHNKKEYRIKGLLQEVGGSKISRNVVQIRSGHQNKLHAFLSKSKVRFQIREIWAKAD